jgi:thiamine phosphate synthase YjbQ (UPF0047 family)
VRTTELTIHTGRRRGVFDITRECAEFVTGEGDGLLSVFVPHATAGLIVMETGSGSDDDLVDVPIATATGRRAMARITWCRWLPHLRSPCRWSAA